MGTVLAVIDGLKLVQTTFAGGTLAASEFNATILEARKVVALLHISNNAGYKVDIGDCTVPRSAVYPNQITVHVRHYDYSTSVDGVAINVPGTPDLSAVTFSVLCLCE